MSFAHVVLISFYDGVPQERRATLLRRLEEMGDACGGEDAGVEYWKATWNLDQRKAYHILQFAIFSDEHKFQEFRAHPAHMAFSNELREIADWVVGDFQIDGRDIATSLGG